ncbi:MAG: toll/interleukin-1 receptor domain-containing protein [Anaerolineaceae bacterium]
MAHDVFISYSSGDKAIADAVCAKLESKKIRCWIAPRDVPAGQPFASSIVDAINESRVIVLVLSTGSNKSVHVLREVSEAVDKGLPIIPLRIEDVEPSTEMRYYIKSLHWLDAMSPPIENHLEKLANSVQALLGITEVSTQSEEKIIAPAPIQKSKRLPIWAIFLLLLIGLGVLGGAGAWILNQQNEVSPTFLVSDEKYWRQTDGSYTTILRPPEDSFVWSNTNFKGDLVFTGKVSSKNKKGQIQVVVYGNGIGFSKDCLIFTFGNGIAIIYKESIYTGDNHLFVKEGDYYLQETFQNVSIEIKDGIANFYIDDKIIASTTLPSGNNRMGRIGLLSHWEVPVGVTYSNIKIKTLGENQ